MSDSQDCGVGPCMLFFLFLFQVLTPITAYWADNKSQDNGDFAPTQRRTQVKDIPASQTQSNENGTQSKAALVLDSDEGEGKDDDIAPLRRGKSKASSRAGSAAPAPTRTATRSKRTATAASKAQPLFVSSGEDDDFNPAPRVDDADEIIDDFDDDQTLPSTVGTTRSRTGAQKPPSSSRVRTQPSRAKKPTAPPMRDDDSDDGALFKGFKGRSKRR